MKIMTSSNIKNPLRELMQSVFKELLFGEVKSKEAEEKNRFLEKKTDETVSPIGIVETTVSPLRVQMLPYPSESKAVSQEIDAPVLEEGCHDTASQLIDKNMDGSLIDNQVAFATEKQEMLSHVKQIRDDRKDRRTLVITGLKLFCQGVLQEGERYEEHDQDLLQQVLCDLGLDFLFLNVANIKWYVGSGTLKLTYEEVAQCDCTLRQMRKWTGHFRSFDPPSDVDPVDRRIVNALKKIKFSFAVPPRMKVERKKLQKFAMSLKVNKKITWFNFQIGKNSALILKTYDKYSKKYHYFDQFGQIS